MKQKEIRQVEVKNRLEKQLLSNSKVTKEGIVILEPKDAVRIEKEIETLKSRLAGEKKRKVVTTGPQKEAIGDKWFIDVYSISFSRTKHSDRRKAKGKSRKKTRTVKTTSLLKSVTLQPGMIQAYREGRMGLSPKSHTFRLRKEEITYKN